ncbi:dihydroneopterin aldolase [Niveispirillum fermenti]|uniref:dihydroneopterin aldolase n=1 Tax=Niveispirillum fermenti TaxID=1233113 RepID=UPI003A86FB9F
MLQTMLRPLSSPQPDPPAREGAQVVLVVRDLVVTTLIGIYDYEHVKPQRLRVNLEVDLAPSTTPWTHAALAETAAALVTAGHTNLLECLAERLAAAILANDRARTALVRLEKLDAFAECEAVGVEIVRAA